MANVKISEFPEHEGTPASGDMVPMVIGGVTKKVAFSNLGGGTNYLHFAARLLDNDEIKALPSQRLVVIPAPGADRIVELVTATARINTQAGAYTASADASWTLFGESGGRFSGLILVGFALTTTDNVVIKWPIPIMYAGAAGTFAGFVTQGGGSTASVLINKAVCIIDEFAGVSDYTDGNALNTALIMTTYVVRDMVTGLLVPA